MGVLKRLGRGIRQEFRLSLDNLFSLFDQFSGSCSYKKDKGRALTLEVGGGGGKRQSLGYIPCIIKTLFNRKGGGLWHPGPLLRGPRKSVTK